MFTKELDKTFEDNKQHYLKLAEQRAIKKLGLTERQALYAKAFETTKKCELIELRNEVSNKQIKKRKQITWRDILFRF